ncbi:hypothetical protein AB0C70_27945 [Streptomyces sp. NPDC048564]|uniref:hypothetical protein n=1 Tax=Streptomyces sp. NPDC048564 TaxID=3155760 RepID=UPI00341EF48C
MLCNGGSGPQKVVDFPSGTTGGETPRLDSGLGRRQEPQDRPDGRHPGHRRALHPERHPGGQHTWLYWSCGSTAGVYDRATNRKITVPADQGPARLAEGFVVRENRTTHELLLTDFHAGTAATRSLVKLPTTDQNTGGSNGRWAVDRFGGHIAYLNGTYGEVSIVRSGGPRLDARADGGPDGPRYRAARRSPTPGSPCGSSTSRPAGRSL